MIMKFDSFVQNIASTEWSSLKTELRQTFEDYSDIGSCPPMSLYDLMITNKSSFENSNTNIVTTSLNGYRYLMVRESVYLAHKAGALLRSYSLDIGNDDQTYAEISAYTASLYLARSITIILGYYMPTSKIGDYFWIMNGRETKKPSKVKMIKVGKRRPGHKEVWDVFKNIIAKTTNIPFDREFVTFITDLATPDISRIRNMLQYNNCAWVHEDLHIFESVDKDWIEPFSLNIYKFIDPADDSSHFPVILSLMLFRNFNFLLKDLGVGFNALQGERNLLIDNMQYVDDVLMTDTWLA